MSRVDFIVDGETKEMENYDDPEDVVIEVAGMELFRLSTFQHVKIKIEQ